MSETTRGTIPMELAGSFALTPISVLTAAFFGLAPGTLLDRVNSWAKANIADLESTSGSDAKQG